MIPIPYAKEILAGLLALSLAALAVQSIRLDRAQDKYVAFQSASKDLLIDAYKEMNKQNVAAELAQSQLDVQYQRGKRDATELSKSVAADLSADNSRLRAQWRSALQRVAQTETTATNSGGNGEAGQLRSDIEDVVRRAAEADARIVRLQNRIDGYLKQINGRGWYDNNRITGRLSEEVWSAPTLGTNSWREEWSSTGSTDFSDVRRTVHQAYRGQAFGVGEGGSTAVADQRDVGTEFTNIGWVY